MDIIFNVETGIDGDKGKDAVLIPDKPPKAADGKETTKIFHKVYVPAQDGTPGKAAIESGGQGCIGGTGKSAGTFVLECGSVTVDSPITICFDGGKGGEGGQGGKGGQGGEGGDAGQQLPEYQKDYPVMNGGSGGDGGVGGQGGQGGNGGNGGTVIINYINSNLELPFVISAQGGGAGSGGKGGPGGEGGIGGKNGALNPEDEQLAPSGTNGNNGCFGLPGNPGKSGSVSINQVPHFSWMKNK